MGGVPMGEYEMHLSSYMYKKTDLKQEKREKKTFFVPDLATSYFPSAIPKHDIDTSRIVAMGLGMSKKNLRS